MSRWGWVVRAWVLGGWLLLVSCGGPETVFEQTSELGPAGWAYTDSIDFTFPVTDTTAKYDLVLSINHGKTFAYQNFYVWLATHLPDGTVKQQRLSLQLADNFGEWYGECSGESCTTEIALQSGTRFTETGEHHLVVTQYSREEPLKDIGEVGFRIVKP